MLRFLLFYVGIFIIQVSSRSHHTTSLHDHESLGETNHDPRLDIQEEDELLDQINELDHMINLVRKARSVPGPEESIVDEDEMVRIMERIDLDDPDNVEAVSDVMKTLSGEKQLEFLMNKFMMHDDNLKKTMVDGSAESRTSFSDSVHSVKVKREAYGGGGGRFYDSHAEPESEYHSGRGSGNSGSFFESYESYGEPHAEYSSSYRQRRSAPGHHEREPEASHGRFFPVSSGHTHKGSSAGPSGILLERSAANHGFQDSLDAAREYDDNESHGKKQMVNKIVDILEKQKSRRRRSASAEDSRTQEELVNSLPRKQPIIHVDI